MSARDSLLALAAERGPALPGSALAWLAGARERGLELFAECGLPTTRDEAWRFTSLKPLGALAFAPCGAADPNHADAANDARAKVEARMQEETQQLMGGLGLPPGLKLPF